MNEIHQRGYHFNTSSLDSPSNPISSDCFSDSVKTFFKLAQPFPHTMQMGLLTKTPNKTPSTSNKKQVHQTTKYAKQKRSAPTKNKMHQTKHKVLQAIPRRQTKAKYVKQKQSSPTNTKMPNKTPSLPNKTPRM